MKEFLDSMSIGALVCLLRKHNAECGNWSVYYSDGKGVGSYLGSWRGIYGMFALGVEDVSTMRLSELIEKLDAAIGTTLYGYKGGEYPTSDDTEIWRDNCGEYSSTAITGVRVFRNSERVVIEVQEEE